MLNPTLLQDLLLLQNRQLHLATERLASLMLEIWRCSVPAYVCGYRTLVANITRFLSHPVPRVWLCGFELLVAGHTEAIEAFTR